VKDFLQDNTFEKGISKARTPKAENIVLATGHRVSLIKTKSKWVSRILGQKTQTPENMIIPIRRHQIAPLKIISKPQKRNSIRSISKAKTLNNEKKVNQ
jgi:hypothetical protein